MQARAVEAGSSPKMKRAARSEPPYSTTAIFGDASDSTSSSEHVQNEHYGRKNENDMNESSRHVKRNEA